MSVPVMASKSSSLQLGHNISFMSEPQTHPTQSSSMVLVIGGGVTGLITAWVLLDRGYQVTIVSKQWASYDKEQRLTSQIAGALWEYPPAVCGQHTDPTSLIRSKEWCMTAYQIWEAIAADPALAKMAGVQMRKSIFFFPKSLVDTPTQLLKLGEIDGSGAHEVRRDVGLIEEMGVDLSCGAVDAYELLVPIIDTDKCMAWLMNLVQHKGACFVTETIRGDIFSEERSLLRRFNAGAIVNASGLASKELALDPSCYPLRGALLRFINDGKDFPKITTAMSIGADASLDNEIMFLVPRNDDILIAGGIAQRDEWYLDLMLDSPVVQRMRARCEAFLPCLKNARLDPEYPLAQGLRPGREKNIRVERDCRTSGGRQSRIVHSYGHGGSGWSLSFGCAEEVVALVEDVLQERDDLSELRCRL
ncbi:nucleotide-binding domain-containing protein [Leptodontidium sp. 2 PMI_412]|nr:nucleotide-binding domain-containing protein [Leptodontidium sp. 2 PMI_412]